MKYCDFLNNYLIENNLSKYALAKKIEITTSGLNFIMNDSSKFPSAMMIEKISKLLNVKKEKVLYLIDAFYDDFENYEESDKALICASLNHRVFCKYSCSPNYSISANSLNYTFSSYTNKKIETKYKILTDTYTNLMNRYNATNNNLFPCIYNILGFLIYSENFKITEYEILFNVNNPVEVEAFNLLKEAKPKQKPSFSVRFVLYNLNAEIGNQETEVIYLKEQLINKLINR